MCIKAKCFLCEHADSVSAHVLCRNTLRSNRFPWRWSKPEARELVLLPPPRWHRPTPSHPQLPVQEQAIRYTLFFSTFSQIFLNYFSDIFHFFPDIFQLFLNFFTQLLPITFSTFFNFFSTFPKLAQISDTLSHFRAAWSHLPFNSGRFTLKNNVPERR